MHLIKVMHLLVICLRLQFVEKVNVFYILSYEHSFKNVYEIIMILNMNRGR